MATHIYLAESAERRYGDGQRERVEVVETTLAVGRRLADLRGRADRCEADCYALVEARVAGERALAEFAAEIWREDGVEHCGLAELMAADFEQIGLSLSDPAEVHFIVRRGVAPVEREYPRPAA